MCPDLVRFVQPDTIVQQAGSNTYSYDCNGNPSASLRPGMTGRSIVATTPYALSYDAENRLTQVQQSSMVQASFVYDGDGNRVQATVDGVTTLYPSRYYEYVDPGTYTKYYFAGSDLIALERSSGYGDTAGYGRRFVLRDHLGSTSVIINGQGATIANDLYLPYGDVRYQWRTGTAPIATQTAYRYTSQRMEVGVGAPSPATWNGVEVDRGLYFYQSRYYDPTLGRFVQPDTIVLEPGNPQALNRYAYVSNNPLRYTDPSGHVECVDEECRLIVHPISGRFRIRSGTFYDIAQDVVTTLGGVNDLDAMATIVEIGAQLYPGWEEFLLEAGNVFIGSPTYGTGALIAAGVFGDGCGGVGREPRDCPGNAKYFLDTGFHSDFRDRHNQPYHVWGYIAQTATPGEVLKLELNLHVAAWGNIVHEIFQSKLNVAGGWGTSWQDFVLSEAGMRIGAEISYGLIASPAELGDTLRRELGPQGPGSHGRLQQLENLNGPLRGTP